MNESALRLDKWLWYARFFKSRTSATRFCESVGIRINGFINKKPHYRLRKGDTLTFSRGSKIMVIKVEDLSDRRGSATNAKTLYADLSPPVNDAFKPPKVKGDFSYSGMAIRPSGSGRPTKVERRAIEKLRDR